MLTEEQAKEILYLSRRLNELLTESCLNGADITIDADKNQITIEGEGIVKVKS